MAGIVLRGVDRLNRLAAARQWRIDNKPYFDAIYGPETETTRCQACNGAARQGNRPMNGGASQRDRVLQSAAAPFDWDQHNRDFDAAMAELRLFIDRDAELGRQFVAATNQMAADVTALLKGASA